MNGAVKLTRKLMPSFSQGDVIRVSFPYTDRPARQYRPALVVSKGGIGEGNRLLWVAMITSAENRAWRDDVSFGDFYHEAGLPRRPSMQTRPD
jgi:mRNA interferase MazF